MTVATQSKKEVAVRKRAEPASPEEKYVQATGRRKTSVARVRLFTKGTGIVVNDKDYRDYFVTKELQVIVEAAAEAMNFADKVKISAHIVGGGIHSQAEALRHGISRVLTTFNPDFRKRLKKLGYLTRDARAKERRKFGLKKARRAPQWSKR